MSLQLNIDIDVKPHFKKHSLQENLELQNEN